MTGLDPSPGRPPLPGSVILSKWPCASEPVCLSVKCPASMTGWGQAQNHSGLKHRGCSSFTTLVLPAWAPGAGLTEAPPPEGPAPTLKRAGPEVAHAPPIMFHWAEPVTCPPLDGTSSGTSRGLGSGGPEVGLVTLTSSCAVRIGNDCPRSVSPALCPPPLLFPRPSNGSSIRVSLSCLPADPWATVTSFTEPLS